MKSIVMADSLEARTTKNINVKGISEELLKEGNQ
jgi:hypothetical protein